MQETVIRWQFDMTWSLLDAYLGELTDADCFWQPPQQTWWTVHRTDDGVAVNGRSGRIRLPQLSDCLISARLHGPNENG
jgi:hypothetical protein